MNIFNSAGRIDGERKTIFLSFAAAIGLLILIPVVHYWILRTIRSSFHTVGLGTNADDILAPVSFLGSLVIVFGIGAFFSPMFRVSRWMDLMIVFPFVSSFVVFWLLNHVGMTDRLDFQMLAINYPAVFVGAAGSTVAREPKWRWLQALWLGITGCAAAGYFWNCLSIVFWE